MNKTERKMRKLLYSKKIACGNVYQVVKETIPDIHYKVEGNNLLHLVGKHSFCSTQRNFLDIINALIRLGIDVNELNDKGQNYLHIICENKKHLEWSIDEISQYIKSYEIPKKLNINQRDKDGKTIMHTILYNQKNHTLLRLSVVAKVFDELLKLGFNEINGFGKEKYSIFELMDIAQKEATERGIINKLTTSDVPLISEEMKKSYYKKYPLELAKQFNDDIDHNANICGSIFSAAYSSYNELLFNLQLKYGTDKEKLLATKRLLDIGFSPTFQFEGNTFIDYAIINKNSADYIISLIDLAREKYYFDINSYGKKIFDNLSLHLYSFDEIERIYSHVIKCGFNRKIDSMQIRVDSSKKDLSCMLEEYNLQLENDIINNRSVLQLILKLKDDYYVDCYYLSDKEFIEKIGIEVINERNCNIGLDNRPINKMELMTGVKSVLIKNLEDNIKIHTLNTPGMSSCKNI